MKPVPVNVAAGGTPNVLPLLPAQSGFFIDVYDQLVNPGCFNVNLLLCVPDTPVESIVLALQQMWRGHAALRAVFSDLGGWHQSIREAEHPAPVRVIDMSPVPQAEHLKVINGIALEHQYSLDIRTGPLARFLVFDYKGQSSAEVLIVAHHLVCDSYSLRLLFRDLATLLAASATGAPSPDIADTYAHDVGQMYALAHSDEVLASLDTWTAVSQRPYGATIDFNPLTILDVVSAVERRDFALDLAFAGALPPTDAALAVIGNALTATFDGELFIQIVRDGRTTAQPGSVRRKPLLSRRGMLDVGWFAMEGAVVLPRRQSTSWVGHARDIADHNQSLPLEGLSWGLLRHISRVDEVQRRILDPLHGPTVWYNHIAAATMAEAPPGSRLARSPKDLLHGRGVVVDPLFSGTALAVEVRTTGSKMSGWVTYDRSMYEERTIAALVDAIERSDAVPQRV